MVELTSVAPEGIKSSNFMLVAFPFPSFLIVTVNFTFCPFLTTDLSEVLVTFKSGNSGAKPKS